MNRFNSCFKRLLSTCSTKEFVDNLAKSQKDCFTVKNIIPSDEFHYFKYVIRNFNLKNFDYLERQYKIFKLDQNTLTANNINIRTSEAFSGLRHFTKVLQTDTKDNCIVVGNYLIWDAHLKLVESFSSALLCVTKNCVQQLTNEHKNELPFEVDKSIFDILLSTSYSDFELIKTTLMRGKMDHKIQHSEPHWLICSN